LTNTEDVNKKMEACGWDIIDVEDGINDVDAIVAAMEKGRDPNRTKPLFINVRSIIGVGSARAGQAASHGAPLGTDNVAEMKRAYGWDTSKKYHIPEKVKKFYADIPARGEQWVSEWNDLVENYKKEHPELGAEFQARVEGRIPADWTKTIPKSFPTEDTPTRKSNNYVMKEAIEQINTFMVGTADLTPSVNLTYKDYEIFNPPDLVPTSKSYMLEHKRSPSTNLSLRRRKGQLQRPLHPLRHSRTRHGSHRQRPSRLLPRHHHPHHFLLLHVLPLCRPRRSHGRPAKNPRHPRRNP
jgi:dihydroxyacetone synthase